MHDPASVNKGQHHIDDASENTGGRSGKNSPPVELERPVRKATRIDGNGESEATARDGDSMETIRVDAQILGPQPGSSDHQGQEKCMIVKGWQSLRVCHGERPILGLDKEPAVFGKRSEEE